MDDFKRQIFSLSGDIQRLEKRLQRLLARQAKDSDSVFALEKELADVKGRIEAILLRLERLESRVKKLEAPDSGE